MPTFGGLRGSGDWGPDERPKDFAERILWLSPNGTAPITALTSRIRKVPTTDPEFSWWSETQQMIRVAVSVAATATDTTLTIDSQGWDPNAGVAPTHWYGSALALVPGDVLMVEAADSTSWAPEFMRVTSVLSQTQFTVQRGVAGSTAAAIPAGTWLLKLGPAYPEAAPAPNAWSRTPRKMKNYTQIFRTTYNVAKTVANTKARTGDILKNERKRKAFDHARDLEFAFLFGRAWEGTDPTSGEIIRYTGGIRTMINTANVYVQTSWTRDLFLNALESAYAFDTEAGNTRIAFCGFAAMRALTSILEGIVDMNAAVPLKLYGMNFQVFQMPFGEIAFKIHPLMSRHPTYNKSILVVDFSALAYRPLQGRDTTFRDNIQPPGDDRIVGEWLTEAGLQLEANGVTCAWLGNVVAA